MPCEKADRRLIESCTEWRGHLPRRVTIVFANGRGGKTRPKRRKSHVIASSTGRLPALRLPDRFSTASAKPARRHDRHPGVFVRAKLPTLLDQALYMHIHTHAWHQLLSVLVGSCRGSLAFLAVSLIHLSRPESGGHRSPKRDKMWKWESGNANFGKAGEREA